MTTTEQLSLSDMLTSASIALEKARILQQDIHEGFFSIDEKTNEGAFEIRYAFHRFSILSDLLGDVLSALAADLPNPEWVNALKAEDEQPTPRQKTDSKNTTK